MESTPVASSALLGWESLFGSSGGEQATTAASNPPTLVADYTDMSDLPCPDLTCVLFQPSHHIALRCKCMYVCTVVVFLVCCGHVFLCKLLCSIVQLLNRDMYVFLYVCVYVRAGGLCGRKAASETSRERPAIAQKVLQA